MVNQKTHPFYFLNVLSRKQIPFYRLLRETRYSSPSTFL